MNDVIKLKSDAPNKVHWPGGGLTIDETDPFRFVEDEDRRKMLMGKGHFRLVEGERLGQVLGGDVDDAVDAIDSGVCDEILDVLHFAEQHTEGRSAVLEAVGHRSHTLEAQQTESGGAISATDLTTTR